MYVAALVHALFLYTGDMIKKFEEFGSVKQSFTRLSDQVIKILQKEQFFNLKLNCRKAVEDAELPDYFSCKVKSSDDTNDLLLTLVMSPYWNWIDIRLMESVAIVYDEAMFMLKQYKEHLHSQNLVDLLSHIPSIHKDVKVNYKTVTTKVKTKIEEITIKDFFMHRHIFETEILKLKEGACILIHVKRENESFEVDWVIPKDQCSYAYKSAKGNLKSFYRISLLSVVIESYDMITTETVLQVCDYMK